jgi:predicted phage gp36 major capsid-like protein
MSTQVAADGGYLVDPQTAERIQSMLLSTSSLAGGGQCGAGRGEFVRRDLIDRSEVGSGWATELAATTETATPTIERISIKLHELSAMPKASQRLLDDSAFDVEGWLAEQDRHPLHPRRGGGLHQRRRRGQAEGHPAADQGGECVLDLGQLGYVPTGAAADFAATNAAIASSTWSMRWARTTGRTAPS